MRLRAKTAILLGWLLPALFHPVPAGAYSGARPVGLAGGQTASPAVFPDTARPGPGSSHTEGRAGTLLRFKAASPFDPLVTRPDFTQRIPWGPRLADPPGTLTVVQFEGPVSAADRKRLSALGAGVLGYVPDNALLVRLPAGRTAGSVAGLDRVRAVSPFLPGYNLSADLQRRLRGDAGSAPVSLRVSLFEDEGPAGLLRAIQTRHPGVEVTHVRAATGSSQPVLTLDVPAADLHTLVGSLLAHPVAFVERALSIDSYNDHAVWIGQSYDRANGPGEAADPDPKPYTQSATLWNNGLLGTGQIIAVADAELETGMCYWDDPAHPVVPQQVDPPGSLTVDPNHRKILAVNGAHALALSTKGTFGHGTHVASTVAADDLANLAGTTAGHDHGDGLAPASKIIFEDISIGTDNNCVATLFVASVGDLLEQEYAAGARISTNSWGEGDGPTAGEYTSQTRQVDSSVWDHEDFLQLFAAGNRSTNGFSDYAACKNCLAVGASENYEPAFPPGALDPENLAPFSSRGPAADGRIKPDLVAPGDRVFSGRFRTQYLDDETEERCDPAFDPTVEICYPDPSIGGCYRKFTAETCGAHPLRGTSMATPAAAGLGALARQYFTDGFHPSGQPTPADAIVPSAALLKAILINGTRNMTGQVSGADLEEAPADTQGWGRIALDDALAFPGDTRRLRVEDVANADGLSTGESEEHRFRVTSSSEPLRVTLVWTDPPALVSASPALVNDLDLEVETADGTIYKGNQWTVDDPGVTGDRESLGGAAGKDAINNVEGVLVLSPPAGNAVARIVAGSVPGHQGVLTQGWALVLTGAIDAAAAGAVPDGGGVPGTPLTVSSGPGGDITLDWGVSCLASDTDYAIYEGTLGDFTGHVPLFCTTGGNTSQTLTPGSGGRYYLVGPGNDEREGSLGTDSQSAERGQGPSACLPREIATCP